MIQCLKICLAILVSAIARTASSGIWAWRACASVVCAAALGACGQQGPLYLPTDPAAANRATLPQTLLPKITAGQPIDPAASPAAKPASR